MEINLLHNNFRIKTPPKTDERPNNNKGRIGR